MPKRMIVYISSFQQVGIAKVSYETGYSMDVVIEILKTWNDWCTENFESLAEVSLN